MKKLSLITAAAIFSLMFTAHRAIAQEAVTCKVLTIEATNNGNGVDDALQPYAAIFVQKPFNTFKSFKLISEKEYTLQLNSPKQLSLPSDLTGTLEFRGLEFRENDKKSLKLQLNLAKNQTAPIVIDGVASNGAPFMAAGYKSPNGRWVIAITCNK